MCTFSTFPLNVNLPQNPSLPTPGSSGICGESMGPTLKITSCLQIAFPGPTICGNLNTNAQEVSIDRRSFE